MKLGAPGQLLRHPGLGGRASKTSSIKRGVPSLLLLLTLLQPGLSAPAQKVSRGKPGTQAVAVGKPAPGFSLPGTDGKRHALTDYRGRAVVVFFYCGCSWCAECAEAWAEMQRSGALPAASGPRGAPITLVVFSGTAEEVRALAENSHLDAKRTVLLADTERKVTDNLYKAAICPRAFVLDAKGVIRYTNNHKDDAPRKAPGMAICMHALDSLRACADKAAKAQKPPASSPSKRPGKGHPAGATATPGSKAP
jgi:peroxiredoxin